MSGYTGNYSKDKEMRAVRLSNILTHEILSSGDIIVGEKKQDKWTVIYAYWSNIKSSGKVTTVWEFGTYQREQNGMSLYKTLKGWIAGVYKNLGIEIVGKE